MLFIISLVLAIGLTALARQSLKKHAVWYYIGAALITIVLGVIQLPMGPHWLETYVLGLFRRGSLATALWCVVMFAGALPAGKLRKLWMPIRGELSILAAILTLCHNIVYGRVYFVQFFTHPAALGGVRLAAVIVSILLLAIMIPLTIISFPAVRRKMSGKRWKSIQRLAYAFYALLYAHILLVMVPMARLGRAGYLLAIVLYSLVFIAYAVLRIQKALLTRPNIRKPVLQTISAAVAVCAMLAVVMLSIAPTKPATPPAEKPQQEQTESAKPENKPSKPSKDDKKPSQDKDDKKDEDKQEEIPENEELPQEDTPSYEEETPAPQTDDSQPSQPDKPTPEHKPSKPSKPDKPAPKPDPEPEPEPEPQTKYIDGTYTATSTNEFEVVTVTVTIENDTIISVYADTDNDQYREMFFDKAVGPVTSAIVANQTPYVDAVSGATTTSESIMAAVDAAMAQALR